MAGLKDAFALFRKLDNLLGLEEEHGKALREVQQRLVDLDRRLIRLESREDIVVNEAKSAARAGAQDAAQGIISDITRRITLLEVRAAGKPRRLPKGT